MSAIEHVAKELQAEAEVAAPEGFVTEPRGAAARATGWFGGLKLASKVRTIVGTFFGLVVIVAIVLTVGLSELYERTQINTELKEASLSSAHLQTDFADMRYNSVRFIFAGEETALNGTQELFTAANAKINAIEATIDGRAPQFSSQVDAMRVSLSDYDQTFSELRASLDRNGRDETSIALAYDLSRQGETFLLETKQFEDALNADLVALNDNGLAYFFNMIKILGGLAIAAAAVLFLGMRYLSRDFSRKIGEITAGMTKLANGDRHFEIEGIERKDEIGEMLKAIGLFKKANIRLEEWAKERAERAEKEIELQQERQVEREQIDARRADLMADLADQFERSVGEVVSSVAAAASQLQTTASSMAGSADESAHQTAEVVKSMEEANAGATAAAAASDEFAMSIGEISRQAASSAELARKASQSANQADETISTLSDSAEQVGQIVEMIQTIAQRTNLLALNASIEAARGGEAGRGFAVVASEVKELAMQTSRATEKVAEQIRAMQDSTGASVNALRTIADQVGKLESTAISIASAVDQQSVAGQDLARSIDLAARSTDRVASHIDDVRELALSTGAAASQVLSSATNLDQQATTLRGQVQDFLQKVRSSD